MEKQFDVIGMTCASCQANVEKAVRKLDGVESVDVSLLKNSMKVEYDESKTNPEAIEQAVSNVGYEAALKGSIINESNPDSIQSEWDARKKQMEKEQLERKQALVWSLCLLIPLMLIAMGPMMGLFPQLMDQKWAMVSTIIQLILTLFILFFQRNFFTHGLKALVKCAPNMDSLVALGGGAAFVYGVYGLLRMAYGYGVGDSMIIHHAMHSLYFESAAMIVTLVSLGKFLEARSKSKTSDALGKLVDLAPKSATIEKDGQEIEVATDQIVSGDIVVIRPGQRIPVDGIVLSGQGYVDQSAITGESIPVEKKKGDPVISATMNSNGTFRFEATKVGSDTTLAQIIRLVDEAGATKAPIARLADKVSGIFVPVVIGIALVTLTVWLLLGKDAGFALSNAIAVLVISCPCALGLATPVAIMVSTGKAAEYGILIKSAESLENLHNINAIVLDKTGTITSGKPSVHSMALFNKKYDDKSFLSLAAALETGSEHPLGKAIIEKAKADGMNIGKLDSFEAISGKGLKAEYEGKTYVAGNQALMEQEGIAIPEKARQRLIELAQDGQTPLLFADDKNLIGIIGVADTIRATSKAAIEAFRKKGIHVVMLTGDNKVTAEAIAKDLQVNQVIADVLPTQKESVIRKLQDEGKKVAMVGDGINDAPALARADIGIAIGTGTDIAIDSADVVLMKDNLMDVNTAIDLSIATIKNIKENLFWAFFYNCLGIPVAAGLFYPFFGWTLSPMLGSAAMSLSSVCVVTNALRLRFFKPKDETPGEIKEQKEKRESVEVFEDYLDLKTEDPYPIYTYEIPVEGMTCSHCTARIEKALTELPGVISVKADFENKNASIKSRLPIDTEAAKAKIEEAGYVYGSSKEDKPEYKYEIPVEGMSCSHCEGRVEQALYELEGVKEVKASAKDEKVVVKSDLPLEESQMEQKIEEAGYSPKKEKEFRYEIPVDGMTCSHCTNHVEQALEKLPGIKEAKASLDDKKALIVSDRPLDEAEVSKQIEEAGYTPRSIIEVENQTDGKETPMKMTMKVDGMSCQHCAKRVIDSISKVDGVNLVTIDLPNGVAHIETVKPVDQSALVKAVEDAGYTPGAITND